MPHHFSLLLAQVFQPSNLLWNLSTSKPSFQVPLIIFLSANLCLLSLDLRIHTHMRRLIFKATPSTPNHEVLSKTIMLLYIYHTYTRKDLAILFIKLTMVLSKVFKKHKTKLNLRISTPSDLIEGSFIVIKTQSNQKLLRKFFKSAD